MRFLATCFVSCVLVLVPQFAFANIAPVANPGGPYQGLAGVALQFDGSRSFDGDGDSLGYAWNFGDSTPLGNGVRPRHTYTVPGNYTVTLVVNDGTIDSAPVSTTATIALPAPSAPITPENEALGIALREFPGLTLVLQWTSVARAEQYYYQYWQDGGAMPGSEENTIDIPRPRGTILASDLVPGARYFWHARACANIDETPGINPATECGAYSESWSFTFLLLPPEIVVPISGNTNLPVLFDWNEVVGAESYLIRGEIDFSSPWWQDVLDFVGDPLGWFIRLAVDFVMDRLGLGEEAIGCPSALWDENAANQEIPCVDVTANRDPATGILPTEHIDTACTFTKETKYRWYIATCLGPSSQHCGEFSARESFETNNTYQGVSGFIIPAPQLVGPVYNPSRPGEIPVVGFNDILAWDTTGDGSDCAHFHKVVLAREAGGTPIEAVDMGSFSLAFEIEQWIDGSKDSPQEKVWRFLDTVYVWTAEPCLVNTEQRGDIDCDEGGPSEAWKFKTTGAIPLNPQSEITNKAKLSWDATPKAGSYKYQVANDNTFSSIIKEGIILEPKTTLSHPDILPQTDYWWRVASCVDPTGVICGTWIAPQPFTTLPLNPPPTPTQPSHGGEMLLPGPLSWQPDPGSSYYQYQASYLALAPDETLQGCQEKVGTQLIQPFPITQQTSFFLNEKCAGEYRWLVRSCADEDCTLATDWSQSQLWTFTGEEGPLEEQPGLVPCGRNKNDPITPYNEKEDCGLQHLGFLLQNLLDFILWKVSLFVLLLLAVITGATSYFSLGGPNALARIKTVFRSFFVGFLILMFAWMFVNIILMLFGFQFEFFGKWWELPF